MLESLDQFSSRRELQLAQDALDRLIVPSGCEKSCKIFCPNDDGTAIPALGQGCTHPIRLVSTAYQPGACFRKCEMKCDVVAPPKIIDGGSGIGYFAFGVLLLSVLRSRRK